MSATDLEKKEPSHSPDLSSLLQSKSEQQPSVTSIASYSGPIPPPKFLSEYERLVPGISKKFLDEPHIEAEHRRAIEKMMAHEQIKLANRGQKMAFCLASLCTIGAFSAILFGYSLEGLGALVASIATFAYIFCYVKKQQ